MFTPKTLSFLRSLKRNNKREWFHERRDQYELHCKQPMIALIEQLAEDWRSEWRSDEERAGARGAWADHHPLPRSLQTAVNSLFGLASPHAHSEVVGKRPARRLALDSPFCFRWGVASSRWLSLTLQLTMIVLTHRSANRPARAPVGVVRLEVNARYYLQS